MAKASLSRANSSLAYREEPPAYTRIREGNAARRGTGSLQDGRSRKAGGPQRKAAPRGQDALRPVRGGLVPAGRRKAVRKASHKKSARPPARSVYVRPWEKVTTRAAAGPVSEQTKRNRERAFKSNIGMVILLIIAMGALMFISIQFLQNKAEYTATLSSVADLESQLASLKEDNDAYYNSLNTNVDLSGLKKRALSQLGMNLPANAQLETYTSPEGSGFMRQYQDAPE